jgi:hypothetical protein
LNEKKKKTNHIFHCYQSIKRDTKRKQAEQKQELILFVESNCKEKKTHKQTRNDSCYCPPLNTQVQKRTYCNILITKREKNHRLRHRQRDSAVCTKYCFVMLKHIQIERDCMRDKALLYRKKNKKKMKGHSQKIKQFNLPLSKL